PSSLALAPASTAACPIMPSASRMAACAIPPPTAPLTAPRCSSPRAECRLDGREHGTPLCLDDLGAAALSSRGAAGLSAETRRRRVKRGELQARRDGRGRCLFTVEAPSEQRVDEPPQPSIKAEALLNTACGGGGARAGRYHRRTPPPDRCLGTLSADES